jgi:non-canonical (house-cleaning) NTP pyrophosphatase
MHLIEVAATTTSKDKIRQRENVVERQTCELIVVKLYEGTSHLPQQIMDKLPDHATSRDQHARHEVCWHLPVESGYDVRRPYPRLEAHLLYSTMWIY